MVFLKKLCLYAIVVLALQIFCSCEPYIGNLFNNTDGVSSRASSITDYTVDFGASYSVLLVSDVHFESVYEEPTKLLSFIESLSVKPVACFVLGDITRNCRESEFNAYLSFCDDIKAAGIQYIYSIPGNHDCDDGGTLYLSKCYPYKSYYRLNTPSFSYYFLDSAEGSHGDDQIQNLTSIMENDSKRKIICSHYPLYADTFADKLLKTTERAVLISLFAKTNVLYYLCGHTHKKQSIDFGRFKQEIVGDLHWSKEWAVLYINESTSSCSYVYY